MTLDSIVASLGSDARNLGAHSLILVQQQQQAAPVPAGQSQPGCGGAQALLQCCYNRLCHSTPRRTRGIIVLSMDHSARVWTSQQCGDSAPPRLILDAVTLRFPLPASAAPTSTAPSAASVVAPAAAAAASEPVSLSSQRGLSVQQLLPAEINSLATLRSIIEQAAARFTHEYEKGDKLAGAAAPAAAAAPPVATADLFSLDGSDPSALDAPASCSSVTLLLDDVVSLFVRFGSAATLAFLQSLKSCTLPAINLVVGCDMDGVAALAPLTVGVHTGGHAAHVSLHSHLAHLASTAISLRAVRALAPGLFHARVQVVHKRSSGRVTNVSEDVEMEVRAGVVRKAAVAFAAAAGGDATAKSAAAASAASVASAASSSLAAQFGSSFSLDLSSKARSARAAVVLPYQHTGQAVGWNDAGSGAAAAASSLDGPEEAEELLLSDDDQDFDDPDDDLEV